MKLSNILENRSYHNANSITIQLLKGLKIPITSSTVIETLEQHPNFPSLLSISESLTKWNIDHVAVSIKNDSLEDLPTPFIAHTKKGKGNFILVNSVKGKVEYIDEKGRVQFKAKEEFVNEWDNIVLLAERTEKSGDRSYRVNRRNEIIDNLRIPFILVLCFSLFLVYFVALPQNSSSAVFLLIIKFIGCFVGGLLLWFDLDKANPALNSICTVGKKTNCTAVLGSKEAKLFNFISWSEVGFFYFTGGFLFLLISTSNIDSAFAVLSWLNVFALPYTFFSIFYQWKIAKQWCPLCLIVQALLLLEFLVGYVGYWSLPHTFSNLHTLILLFGTAFLLPIIFWVATKNMYMRAQNSKQLKKDLARMMYNKDVLDSLLIKQKEIKREPDSLGILLGNAQAKNTIIKVCHPFCGPCSKAHPVIDELLAHNTDIRVQIIFSITNDHPLDRTNIVVNHLLGIYKSKDPELMKAALDEWYGKQNYSEFVKKFPLIDKVKDNTEHLKAMKDWCNETNITFTPTFFLNNFQLPEVYKVEDLKHIL